MDSLLKFAETPLRALPRQSSCPSTANKYLFYSSDTVLLAFFVDICVLSGVQCVSPRIACIVSVLFLVFFFFVSFRFVSDRPPVIEPPIALSSELGLPRESESARRPP